MLRIATGPTRDIPLVASLLVTHASRWATDVCLLIGCITLSFLACCGCVRYIRATPSEQRVIRKWLKDILS